MKPTDEQLSAIELFADRRNLKINAFAGTGKTETLRMISEYASGRSGLYLAFNRSIADEARARFPESVDCQTTHSFAYRATPEELRRVNGKMAKSLNANAAAQILDLREIALGDVRLNGRAQGYLVLQTLRRFAQSDSRELSAEHVPFYGRLALAPPGVLRPFRDSIHKAACSLWEKMCDPGDPTPLGHDGYLKCWALGEPVLDVEFVLLDEAQDSNSVLLHVLEKQQSQIIYVGDQYQQIYEWRGAVNAMQSIGTPNAAYLTEAFRFGDPIAEAASCVLAALGEGRRVRGNPAVASRVGPTVPRAILCRTNAEAIVRCLGALDSGYLPHIVGGAKDLIRMLRGVTSLKRGIPSDVLEFFGFKTWSEVVGFAGTPEGEHLKSFVRIVDQHGEHALISALEQTTDEEANAGVVISTAHKAKGREWETVVLADDFRIHKSKEKPDDADEFDLSELRLLYVAITRAKRAVQIPDQIEAALGIARTPEPG